MAGSIPSTFADLDGLLGSAQLPTLIGGPRTFAGSVTHNDLVSSVGKPSITGTVVSVSLTSGIATFNMTAAFPVQVGYVVRITGLSGKDNGAITTALNGTWTVASVPTGTSFTAAIPEADCTLTTDTGTVVAAPNSMAFATSDGTQTLGLGPLANIHAIDDFYTGTLHFRGASGGAAWKVRAGDEVYPRSLGASMGSIGNIFTAAWLDIGPNYDDTGAPYGISAGNANNVSFIEAHMISVWPDIAAPAVKIAGTAGSQENATAFALYNSDAPDGNFFASRWGSQTPIKQFVAWGDGRHDWGPNLGKTPKANRTASLYRSLTTGYMTFAGDATTNLASLDLVRSGAAGTGATQLAIGRNTDGTADLVIHSLSSASSAPTLTFTILTPDGDATAFSFANRFYSGVNRAACKVPLLFANTGDSARNIILGVIPGQETLPGLWIGIDPTTQSTSNYSWLQNGVHALLNVPSGGDYAFRVNNAACATLSGAGAFQCNAGITSGDTILANAPGGAIRIGWSGTDGEQPYYGIWGNAPPTLGNFAMLFLGTSTVFNTPNGGTVQIRISNGGGANFSQTSTDLDRAGVGITVAGHKIQYAAAAPTSGAWLVGDVVYNTAPAASGTIGWVCTTAGSPGTWKTWGSIAA